MKGVWREARAEWGRQWRRPALWGLVLVFFVLGWGAMQVLGGALRMFRIVISPGGETLYLNSPDLLHFFVSGLTLLGIPVTAALIGGAVGRDYAHRMSGLLWTTPLGRWSYWWGRFAGALATNLVVFAAVPLGLWVGRWMPWLEGDQFGATPALGYVHPLWISVLPRCLVVGAVAFVLVARTRRLLAGLMASVVICGLYLTAGRLLADLDNRWLAALIDPSGSVAVDLLTRYWSIAEKNTRLIPLAGPVLAHRLLWGGLAMSLLVVGGWRFRPEAESSPPGRLGRLWAALLTGMWGALRLPRHALGLLTSRLPLTLRLALLEYRGVVAHPVFWITVAFGALALLGASGTIGNLFGTPTWPVTYHVLEVMGAVFRYFALGILLFFSGELIWRERRQRMAPLLDSLPGSTWRPVASKMLALLGVIATLQLVVFAAALLFQWRSGYQGRDWGLYLSDLFGFRLIDLALFAVLAVLLQVLIRQRLVAYLATVLVYLGSQGMPAAGLGRLLYRYGGDPGLRYSELNGFHPFLVGWWTAKAYWLSLAVILVVAVAAFWVRGEVGGFGERWRVARRRSTPAVRWIAATAALAFASLGGWIFYNTDVLNAYQPAHVGESRAAAVEQARRPWIERPQPRIVATSLEVDLYPAQRDARVRGEYVLRNSTPEPIAEVLVRLGEDREIERLEVDRGHRLSERSAEDPYRVLSLDRPLAPGEEMRMDFAFYLRKDGFPNAEAGLGVLDNGTFLDSSALPGIGYDPAGEIRESRRRRELGLPERPRMLPVDDPWGRAHNAISTDADRLRFEAVVSTAADQVALAPGDLVEEWEEGGRRYFRYRSAVPILNFFAFVSGRYALERDRWGEVDLEIYHHPRHPYNVDTMMRGMKASLDYLSEAFGPYPHGTLRIVEFPRHAAFAQSFPTVIPFSEALGFIARLEDPDDIDYPFYVTAHEVAHQWWGHKVVAAQTEGATLLIESLAQYSALRVMERQYGRELIGRFLRYELDRYLLGRSVAPREEKPLARVEMDQQYLHYNKASLATYALADRIGVERMDAILAEFVESFGETGPPYPTSEDLLGLFAQRLDEEEMRWADDLFRRITLFDLETVEATCRPTPEGRFEVELKVRAAKRFADGEGAEEVTPMDAWVDVGVMGEKRVLRKTRPVELALESHRLSDGEQTLRLVVDRRPTRAGVDPHHKLVDRKPEDNVGDLDCGDGQPLGGPSKGIPDPGGTLK